MGSKLTEKCDRGADGRGHRARVVRGDGGGLRVDAGAAAEAGGLQPAGLWRQDRLPRALGRGAEGPVVPGPRHHERSDPRDEEAAV